MPGVIEGSLLSLHETLDSPDQLFLAFLNLNLKQRLNIP